MFLESYHYAGRGGEAPILKIARVTSGPGENSRLFEIYARHFQILWEITDVVDVSPPATVSIVEQSSPQEKGLLHSGPEPDNQDEDDSPTQ